MKIENAIVIQDYTILVESKERVSWGKWPPSPTDLLCSQEPKSALSCSPGFLAVALDDSTVRWKFPIK